MFRIVILAFLFHNLNAIICSDNSFVYDDHPSVALLQKYIQINTTTYNDLGPAIRFWRKLAIAEGLTLKKYVFNKRMPVLVIKWPGQDPTLQSVMLNSHMDVVPAFEEDGWSHPPFAAYIENGTMYGRGTQDMKSVAIQYYEALKNLRANNVALLRDVYMTLMPDEEVGGVDGMIPFVQSEEFKAMNVGIILDEGGAVDIPMIPLFYQDKAVWQIRVDCYGTAGHSSSFSPTNVTAVGKCRNVMNNLFEFRDEQYTISTTAPSTDGGVYTSLNLNRLFGGVANNVVPGRVSLIFDMRLNTRLDEDSFQQQLENMIYAAGDNITITYISRNLQSPATIANASNPYWEAIINGANNMNISIISVISPGSTDSRHARLAGYPAFGISPQSNTPTLLHSVNEHLGVDTFLTGITFYENVITNLCNIPGNETTNNQHFLHKTAVL